MNRHVESNLSANGIRDVIARLLAAFDIPADEMRRFLRQDRDAGRNNTDSAQVDAVRYPTP